MQHEEHVICTMTKAANLRTSALQLRFIGSCSDPSSIVVFALFTSPLIYGAIVKMVSAEIDAGSSMQQDNTGTKLRNQDDRTNGG